MSTPLCIYHGGCDDGWAAAWVTYHAFDGEIELWPAQYGDKPPKYLKGRDIVIVDFSYRANTLHQIAEQAASVLLLDHHDSAQRDLAALKERDIPNLTIQFDMDRSGCMMAWDYFNEQQRMPFGKPLLLDYIQDCDLWHKRLPFHEEVIMTVRSYPQDLPTWDTLMLKREVISLADEGKPIKRYYNSVLDALAEKSYFDIIGSHVVPVCNAPFQFASDLAGRLAQGQPFAACYYDTLPYRHYSLRSIAGYEQHAVNVARIAEQYGGGGHPHAAGFRIPLAALS